MQAQWWGCNRPGQAGFNFGCRGLSVARRLAYRCFQRTANKLLLRGITGAGCSVSGAQPISRPSAAHQPPSTAAMALALRATLPVFSPATQMRPERSRYTACCSRSASTCAALRPV